MQSSGQQEVISERRGTEERGSTLAQNDENYMNDSPKGHHMFIKEGSMNRLSECSPSHDPDQILQIARTQNKTLSKLSQSFAMTGLEHKSVISSQKADNLDLQHVN